MKTRILMTLCVVVALVAGTSQGSVALYDGFEYPLSTTWSPDTSLQSNVEWTGAEPQPWSVGVITGLSYPGLDVAGGALGIHPNVPGGEQYTQSSRATNAAVSDLFSDAGTFYITLLVKGAGTVYVGDTDRGTGSQGGKLSAINESIAIQVDTVNYGLGTQLGGYLQVTGASESQAPVDPGVFIDPANLDTYMLALKIVNDGGTGNDSVSMVWAPDLSAGEPNWATAVTIDNQDITTSAEIHIHHSPKGTSQSSGRPSLTGSPADVFISSPRAKR